MFQSMNMSGQRVSPRENTLKKMNRKQKHHVFYPGSRAQEERLYWDGMRQKHYIAALMHGGFIDTPICDVHAHLYQAPATYLEDLADMEGNQQPDTR
jgi:hypothetical protein